ncbi:hypothetical protein J2741_000872 [Methanolinea mesophila]|uniref:PEGA domain-containing protein n=1 Tax=Methanolinea mesophila TaxID=547055 RepID=UPI001AEA6098|nr:PEGA domain-containing protein [Methanolinea mesophila]MBP1928325.1 hypothetical protein [Methanolinea mesophila]
MLCAAVLLAGLCGVAAAQIGGDVGYYYITSSPSGASVYFDGSYKGTTPTTVQVYTSGTPGHTLSLTLSGYQTYTQSIAGNPSEGQTVTIFATLTPMPGSQTGYYQISSSPSNADVYFDSVYKGTTPVTVEVSTTGTPGHTINVYKSGYESFSQFYPGNPSSGQTVYVYAALTPVQSTGSVYATSSPSGASVYLDDVYMGTTPNTFTSISTGTHTIRISRSGYQTYTGSVTVSSGSTTTVSVTLPPISSSVGSLYVTSSPSGASLYIDGTYRGTTPTTAGSLTPGSHTVRLSLAGYQDFTTTATVYAGQTTTLSANLVQVTPTTTLGTLAISSSPSAAEVYVDNVFRGYSPLTLNDISPGSHAITLRLAGYQDWQGNVQVSAGQTTSVQGTLIPVPTTVPTTKAPGFGILAGIAALGLIGAVLVIKRD